MCANIYELQLVYMNPSAEMLLEASTRRLCQLPFHDWFQVDDDQNALTGALEKGHPFTKREAKLTTLAGREITIDYSVNPMPQKYGRLVLIELTPRDRLCVIVPPKQKARRCGLEFIKLMLTEQYQMSLRYLHRLQPPPA